MFQHLILTNHWILVHKDLLNNNVEKYMLMLDPCKNIHVGIQKLIYQDQSFYIG